MFANGNDDKIGDPQEVINYLKKMKERFVFVGVDKAPQTIAIVCRKLYCSVLKERLGKYQEISREHALSLVNEVKEMQKKLGCFDENRNIPYLGLLPKFHKEGRKEAWREVVGTSNQGLSLVEEGTTMEEQKIGKPGSYSKRSGTLLAHALEAILHQMKLFGDEREQETGIKHFFVLNRTQDLVAELEDSGQDLSKEVLCTTDFSNMYTALDADKVMQAVDIWVKVIFNRMREALKKQGIKGETLRLVVSSDGPYDGHTFTYAEAGLTCEDVIELARVATKNAIFSNGGKFYLQSAGIAIGAEPSQQLANLYCASVEWM
eukprot:PhF_6_TR15907/c0_g1_i3/m.24534